MREGGDQEGGPPASRRRGDRVGAGGGPIAITGPTPDRAATALTSVMLAHSHTLPA